MPRTLRPKGRAANGDPGAGVGQAADGEPRAGDGRAADEEPGTEVSWAADWEPGGSGGRFVALGSKVSEVLNEGG